MKYLLKRKFQLFSVLLFFIFFNFQQSILAQTVPQSEKDALIALYNSTDGANWANNTNWNTAEPVSTWAGITVVNNHVTRIDKNRGNLVGTLPIELQNLPYLEHLQLSRNNLSGTVPDLTGLANLNFFNINLNDFQFGDFENEYATYAANIAFFGAGGMNKVELESDVDLVVGQTYAMNMPVISGTSVTYQWYKNNEPIIGETGLTYTITNAQEADAGNYTCKASSSVITDLVIERETVHIYRDILASDRDALVDLYNATNGANWTTNTNWNTAAPVYQWHGVTMSDNRVIEINLESNNLVGTLPVQIGDLDNLEKLILNFNNLTGSIPVTLGNCTALIELNLWENNLSGTIPSELGNCTSLEIMSLENNQLTGNIPTSFSNLTAMVSFWVNGNLLSGEIPDIVSNWPELYFFSIGDINGSGSYNNFTGTLDFSNNPVLSGCWVEHNNLSALNLQNGNNTNFIANNFNATNNPNLECIQVDDATYSFTNWTNLDVQTSFSTDCSNTTTIAIPDTNFEQALIDLGFDTNGLNGNILEANALAVIELYINNPVNNVNLPNVNSTITDLTGIEGFTNLTRLVATDNSLTSINVTQNTALEWLYLGNNLFSTIDISNNLALTRLNIIGNNFSNIDVTNHTALTQLYIGGNNFSNIDVSNNLNLDRLSANDNQLTSIDVAVNTLLTRLELQNNQIAAIDVTNNAALIVLYLENNLLTSVDVSQNTSLLNLAIGINPITSLDISMLPQLPILTTEGTLISSLDLSQNINLEQLWIADNPNLTNIDFSNNPLLWNLGAYNTPLESLDLSNNAITRLYASDMPNLYRLDLANGNNLNVTEIFLTNNPSLECVSVDDAAYATTNWTNIDPTATYSENCNSVWTVYTSDENLDTAINAYLGVIDTDMDGVMSYEEASNFTGTLDLSGSGIVDITGLEAFTSITEINLSGNSITDISRLIFGNVVTLTRNGLEFKTVERRGFNSLQILNCSNNNLKQLDVSIITTLTSLDCSNNQLEILNVKNGNNTSFVNFDASGNPGLYCALVDDISYSNTNWTLKDTQTLYSDTDCNAKIQPKVFLQGAMLNPIPGEEHLMRDNLRALGYIPTTSPYADGLTCDVSIFNVTGDNAIVDWVEISLRDASNSGNKLQTRSALLQRDGDVVDVDGASEIAFDLWAKPYFISINHRNHLGIMSNTSNILNFMPSVFNFADGSIATYGTNAQTSFGMPTGVYGLWSGDTNSANQIKFSGANNGSNKIKDFVLADPANGFNSVTFSSTGYLNIDLNMDGNGKFSSSGNDSNVIKDNVLSHPANGFNSSTFTISATVPE
ncbi:immunoglobulin domain-containing protein [Xanthomarina sp. GH4-25]|uniref:immunoglobulin domain-containing protein n=1 Tax=Xanthomarina sp. GH4-25 TaxID=3349335 RepID=UPI00387839FE